MTKAPERGISEIVEEAKRQASRTKRSVCEILKEWRKKAKANRDKKRLSKLIAAEKYLGCRNKGKRRK
jgi:hypothetical protein